MKKWLACIQLVLALASPAAAHAEERPAPTRMRSIPLFVTGIVLDTIGATATAGGVGLILAFDDCDHRELGCRAPSILSDLAGVGAIAGGAIFLAIGVPLTVVGATSVPDVKSASAVPTLRVGPNGGALSWSF